MLVLRIAVIVLINRSPADVELAQETRVDELGQRSINSRAADVAFLPFAGKFLDQLVGVKMIVLMENALDQ